MTRGSWRGCRGESDGGDGAVLSVSVGVATTSGVIFFFFSVSRLDVPATSFCSPIPSNAPHAQLNVSPKTCSSLSLLLQPSTSEQPKPFTKETQRHHTRKQQREQIRGCREGEEQWQAALAIFPPVAEVADEVGQSSRQSQNAAYQAREQAVPSFAIAVQSVATEARGGRSPR